jgi:sugar phosphate isomerase/epimerase
MNVDQFGVDTITFAGPLAAKLQAAQAAGFRQVMLNATDLTGDPGGIDAAVAAVRASGLHVTGFQVLRDFEGLSGHLHAYKVDIAKAMLDMCHALNSRVLLACSTVSSHSSEDFSQIVRDLQKLAMLAVPLGIHIAYEALSWGRHVNLYPQAWKLVQAGDRANLGLAIDSYHILAHQTPLDTLREIDPEKIALVQLSDFMWQDVRSREDRIETARHFRVFPARECTAQR